MAVICITGSDSPQLQAVENILLQAGMQAPRPAPKEEPIDIRQWHHHLLANIDGESSGSLQDPGRLWELLAGEIILANLKSPLWGWCDPASLRFLDFWLGFAPEIKFLLVCQTPQQLLAERLGNSDVPLNLAELLELWKSQQQEMLRFHHRNPERSILVNAADAVAHPELVVAECGKRWKLSLSAVGSVIPSSSASQDALANFVSCRVASLHPEIDALNREILATATIFAPTTVEGLTDEPQLEEILADYLALRQRLAGEKRKFRKESARFQSELSGVRDALSTQKSEDAARQVELQGKNAQLLLQLEHVQEELETVFAQGQELKEQIEVLNKEKSVAGEEQKTFAAGYVALQKEIEQQKEIERQKEIELLLLHSQLQQVQAELGTALLQGQVAQEQIAALTKEKSVAGEERATLAAKYDTLQQELTAVRLARDEQARVLSERDAQIEQLTKARNEQSKLAIELQKRADDLVREGEGHAREMKEQQQENELLLLQLHQTQEELETVFLKENEAQEQLVVLKRQKSALRAERAALTTKYDGLQQELSAARLARDEQTRVLAERQVQVDQLTKDREQQKKLVSDLQNQREALVREHEEQVRRLHAELKEKQQENELFLLQLQQVHGELETVSSQELEAKKQLSVIRSAQEEHTRVLAERQVQIDQLAKDRDQQKKLASEQQKQAAELARELAGQVREVKEQQQENELLLLQMQQIQEELERSFLQQQQIQPQPRFPQVNHHRLLEREPKFYDYTGLEVSPGTRGDASPSLNCRLIDLIAAGRQFPTLAFSVAIEQGVASLLFPAATLTTFLRPPLPMAGESEVVIGPSGPAEKLPQRLNQLATLATSDWFLVSSLIRLLKEALAKPNQLQWNSPLSSQTFLSALQELERQIEPYEARLRYDKISLKREQVNPDYEHLWFEFVNLSFAGEIWPHFEFRLSCAHVRPDHFGGFPKLEFPAGGSQAPFEGWFIEAADDFGDKLELRFSLADKALDLGVWERVTEHDRAFIKALTADLPQFLAALQKSGVQIARSWQDWGTMAAEMQSVLTQRENATITAIAAAPAEEEYNVSSVAPLRYDKVRLKREQVNPDYEHLWFEFANLAFAGESWPHFEFRLSCAHVRPGHFGGFPKLEFPAEGSQAPFKGWFIEASDDFGEKLELRFSLPDKALDLGVWERVTEHDRAFMKALVAELPHLFSTLQQSRVKIRRPWEDWTKMAEEMLPIVTNPPKLKGKKKSSFKKLLRRLQLSG